MRVFCNKLRSGKNGRSEIPNNCPPPPLSSKLQTARFTKLRGAGRWWSRATFIGPRRAGFAVGRPFGVGQSHRSARWCRSGLDKVTARRAGGRSELDKVTARCAGGRSGLGKVTARRAGGRSGLGKVTARRAGRPFGVGQSHRSARWSAVRGWAKSPLGALDGRSGLGKVTARRAENESTPSAD